MVKFSLFLKMPSKIYLKDFIFSVLCCVFSGMLFKCFLDTRNQALPGCRVLYHAYTLSCRFGEGFIFYEMKNHALILSVPFRHFRFIDIMRTYMGLIILYLRVVSLFVLFCIVCTFPPSVADTADNDHNNNNNDNKYDNNCCHDVQEC